MFPVDGWFLWRHCSFQRTAASLSLSPTLSWRKGKGNGELRVEGFTGPGPEVVRIAIDHTHTHTPPL